MKDLALKLLELNKNKTFALLYPGEELPVTLNQNWAAAAITDETICPYQFKRDKWLITQHFTQFLPDVREYGDLTARTSVARNPAITVSQEITGP